MGINTSLDSAPSTASIQNPPASPFPSPTTTFSSSDLRSAQTLPSRENGSVDASRAGLHKDLLSRVQSHPISSTDPGILSHLLTFLAGLQHPRHAQHLPLRRHLQHLPDKAKLASVAENSIANLIQRQEYILLLIRGEILFGAPIHRVEDSVSRISQVLRIQLTFLTLPSLHIVNFADSSTHTSELYIQHTSATWSMGKLEALELLSQSVLSGERTIEDVLGEMRPLVLSGPLLHPWPIELVAWFIGSGALSAAVYNGGWKEVLLSSGLSLVVWTLFHIRSRHRLYSELFETTAAILVAFTVTALRNHICYIGAILSPLSFTLPGFPLMVSTTEILSGNMLQGSIRLIYSITRTFIFGYGLSFGQSLWALCETGKGTGPGGQVLLSIKAAKCQADVGFRPPWIPQLIGIPLMSIAFAMRFHASFSQLFLIMPSGIAGYVVNYFLSKYVHQPFLTRAAAGFSVGIVSNLLSRYFRRIAVVPTLPSILMLVPGSFGVRGVLSIIGGDTISDALSLTVQMILICLGLTLGLFFASFITYPLGSERKSILMLM
ncbi:MAG: hypothetical protein DHS80DRAFT_20598 [Piptocephalis tieghemiana]|nr:MAG: hypothetical protein DHS80DRAFT_20598 [Piptocephalis tieghemiana]